jgi:uncharacterized damage-inducible protein DinB
VDQLHRSYAGPAWHGPSLNQALADVTEEVSARVVRPGVHSIWEIALHATAWIRIARERLMATAMRNVTAEEDWPAPSGRWADVLADLDREQRALEEAVRTFPEERLDQAVPAPEPQTYHLMLYGVAQHNAYHAGQIMILKK